MNNNYNKLKYIEDINIYEFLGDLRREGKMFLFIIFRRF